MWFKLLISSFTLIATISCQAQQVKKDTLEAVGTVYLGTPVAVDGCGNLIVIDTIAYKTLNLPEEYKIDGLKVKINYTMGETFYCGRGRAPIETIEIHSIQALKESDQSVPEKKE